MHDMCAIMSKMSSDTGMWPKPCLAELTRGVTKQATDHITCTKQGLEELQRVYSRRSQCTNLCTWFVHFILTRWCCVLVTVIGKEFPEQSGLIFLLFTDLQLQGERCIIKMNVWQLDCHWCSTSSTYFFGPWPYESNRTCTYTYGHASSKRCSPASTWRLHLQIWPLKLTINLLSTHQIDCNIWHSLVLGHCPPAGVLHTALPSFVVQSVPALGCFL